MKEKFYTVPEYAQLRNISESAVYQQIRSGKLKTTEKQNEAGRHIKLIVVNEDASQENEETSQPTKDISEDSEVNNTNTSQPFEASSQVIEALTQVIEALQKQLEAKDKQIAQLHEIITINQQLHAQSNTLFLNATTEPQPEPEAAIVAAEPPKKSFFSRLFNK